MAIVLVSLRDVPPEVRMSAVCAAMRSWTGEPEQIIQAALFPSEQRYPVDEGLYESRAREWGRAA